MNKPNTILAGNWKLNFSPKQATQYFNDIQKELSQLGQNQAPLNCDRVIFAPAYCLGEDVQKSCKNAQMHLGAQNSHWEDSGAFTGELSPKVLQSIGIEWTLIAHSERRQFFGESNESAGKRLNKALKANLNIVFCIGESLKEREAGQTFNVLKEQLSAFTGALTPEALSLNISNQVSIAYEPVWAIGTGKTATTEQAEEAHAFIRKTLAQTASSDFAQKCPILYGGSVNLENAKSLLSLPNVNGVLVGGASLKPAIFAGILASLP